MGRKTWDGIPPKFRPLRERSNHVVSRAGVDVGGNAHTTAHTSLEDAVAALPESTHRAFLIGGAQLYNQALPTHCDRVLLTRVLQTINCDAFLADFTADAAWRRASHQELCDWVGWEVPEGDIEEKGIKYRFEMWVRS
jgi:dihydrofolate reductase